MSEQMLRMVTNDEVLTKVAGELMPLAIAVMASIGSDQRPTGEPAASLKDLVDRMGANKEFRAMFGKMVVGADKLGTSAGLVLMFVLGVKAAEIALAEGVKV